METLGQAVNLFTCCIFTLNVFTIVLPAFLVAGALVVFVPSHSIMKYLGARANRIISYGAAAISGNVLTVCSCNVVPIFAGILRRGAGIGPAFCFVFAAPAIHIVNTAFTYQVIGPKLALWRFFMVPLIAIVLGALIALLFRREEQERQYEVSNSSIALVDSSPEQTKRGELFLGLLVGVLIFGAWMPLDGNLPGSTGQYVRLAGVLLAVALLVLLAIRWFGREESYEWGRQTWLLLRMIVPIFLVAVVAIALIVQRIPISWVMPTAAEQGGLKFGHPQGNSLPAVFLTAVFSTLMYFPMLTEVAFTKGLLLQYFALGPALALLLGGPGLSLPGLLLVSKVAGFRKMLIYWVLMVLLITVVAFAFGKYFGEYECSCQRQGPGSEALVGAPPIVGWIGAGWYIVVMGLLLSMLFRAKPLQQESEVASESA